MPSDPPTADVGPICEGGSRGEAAALAEVGLQTVCDWALRFNAEDPGALMNRKAQASHDC